MMFTCAPAGPATSRGGGRRVADGAKSLIVDIHCHCRVQAAAEIVAAGMKDKPRPPARPVNELTRAVGDQQVVNIEPKMSSVAVRLADMDRMGIDIQAVSPAPRQYYYWTDPEVGRAAARAVNEHLAQIVADHPERFVALGNVPLQDAEMAVAELDHCVSALGMRGVEIATNVNGREVSERRLDPFFARAEELDVVLFVHPSGFTQPDRFFDHYFTNLIGNPLDTTVAVGHLIFDGVLARYPGLKICVAHGGGYAAAYAGRFDHGYHARADRRTQITEPPSAYMRKLYFDTMVFEPDQLGFLVAKYGSDHVLLGTDYPYDMGEDDPVGLVGRVANLSDANRARICGLNAAALLKIPVPVSG